MRPNRQTPTAWQTLGPFFPAVDGNLSALTALGGLPWSVVIEGRILDERGAFANAVVELVQADGNGFLPQEPGCHPTFRFWGRAATDAEGRFTFLTNKPGPHADPAGTRAPCLELRIIGSGIMRRLVTVLFFPGEPANAADPVLLAVPEALRPLLMLRLVETNEAAQLVRYEVTINLAGPDETPFFRD